MLWLPGHVQAAVAPAQGRLTGMSRYERRIFKTQNFEEEVAYRETFGWEYVKQWPRSRTVRAYHGGGGMSTGSGFIGGGTTSFKVLEWTEIEMRRSRANPNFEQLVRCERIYENGGASPVPEGPESFLAITFVTFLRLSGLAMAVFLLGGLIEFVAPSVKVWMEKETAGLSLAMYVASLLGAFLAFSLLWATWHAPRIQRERKAYNELAPPALAKRQAEKNEAWETAKRLTRAV